MDRGRLVGGAPGLPGTGPGAGLGRLPEHPALAADPLLAGAEVIPGAQTVLIDGVADPYALVRRLADLPEPAPLPASDGELVELPVVYDGPDLALVGEHWGVPAGEVGVIHAATPFRVAFVGFAPGFGYLTGLPGRPGGAPAGESAYPGAGRQRGARGRVHRGVSERLAGRLAAHRAYRRGALRPGPAAARAAAPGCACAVRGVTGALTVLDPGPLTTVQDLGRPGWAALGVPRSGALDPAALRLANRLVGNDEAAAGLEITLAGCRLRSERLVFAALTGAPASLRVDGRPVPFGAPFAIPAGGTLRIGPALAGVRSYLAFGGGVTGPAGTRQPQHGHALRPRTGSAARR